MENLQRCPDCYKLPKVVFEDAGFDKSKAILSCEEHGHMAMGDTVEGAVANWNLYVMLSAKKVA
jgi:hypothetical protein